MKPLRAPKAVIFDMDGTITRPYLDFAKIKREIGAKDSAILEFLATLAGDALGRAREKVDAWEREGAEASTLNPGVREALAFLKERGIPTAILTRNTRESVDVVTAKHSLAFDVVVTADDALPPKPSPEPVRHIAQALGVDPRDMWVVGDFRFDIESGRAAGATTVFLRTNQMPGFAELRRGKPGVTPREESPDDGGADFVIDGLDELLALLSLGKTRDKGGTP